VNTKRSQRSFNTILLFFAFLLANLRATMFVFLHPDTSMLLGPAWIEISLWLFLSVMILYDLSQNNQLGDYLSMWRRNWIPALFILLVLLSSLWSKDSTATAFRSLEVFFAAFVASYFGMHFVPEKWMDALFWFGALLFILSLALVFGAPPTGTMYWAPFNGAWRGVYWHRNHLASISALLSVIFLCRILIAFQDRNSKGILDAFLYLSSIAILYFTRSATGYILLVLLHFFVLVIWLWLRIHHRLQRRHYLLILGGGTVAGILLLTNLDFVFGLFNRDTSMTGRVGLWGHLFDIASQHLWFGHGFGAVWTLDSFREAIRQRVAWTSQPLIADNGLLDIFLHLGITGLFVFSCLLILATVRSLQYGVSQKTLTGFFPLLVMVYAFLANITFSLFAETEVFVWLLIIAALFMTTPSSDRALIS
jgi:exopolysaccharide production protein ExoQ